MAINGVENATAAAETLRLVRVADSPGITEQADRAVGADRERAVTEFFHWDLLVNNARVGPKERTDLLEAGEESFGRRDFRSQWRFRFHRL